MRILLVVLFAGCAARQPYAWSDRYLSCQLVAGGLDCTAVNTGTSVVGATTFCVEPYLVVRKTGAVRGKVSCAPRGIPEGARIRWLADLGAQPAELCGPDFTRCAMYVVGDNGNPASLDELHRFIRGIQDVAPERDLAHPSVRECEAAAWWWRANPLLAARNELAGGNAWFVRACLAMPRQRFECLRRVRTDVALAACG